jgi:hypothetical protein
VASNSSDPGAPRFPRGTPEFDRALAFFDATYAVALTLLVTTLDGIQVPGAWADLAALWAAIGNEIVAFFLAFAIVAFYWRANHAFVARLHHLSGRLITVNLVLLAFVVLLPFSTDVLGGAPGAAGDGRLRRERRGDLLDGGGDVRAGLAQRADERAAVTPADTARAGAPARPPGGLPRVDPVAFLISSSAARLSWLSLVVLGPVVGILVSRRAPLV